MDPPHHFSEFSHTHALMSYPIILDKSISLGRTDLVFHKESEIKAGPPGDWLLPHTTAIVMLSDREQRSAVPRRLLRSREVPYLARRLGPSSLLKLSTRDLHCYCYPRKEKRKLS